MKSTVSFQALLQRFFTDRLMQQRQASAHTISSYRDTFRLLLRFAHKRLHKTPDQLAFEDIDAPLVATFLNDLEKTRDIGARTRNLRLTAIRSFFRYAAFEAPAYSAQIQRVLSMHGKRHDRTLIRFLTRPEVDALLAAPDQSTWYGRRDHALLLLAVETGLRVSEISGLTREQITVTAGAHVDVTGKGRKQRVTPFCKRTARILRGWSTEPTKCNSTALFPNAKGRTSQLGRHTAAREKIYGDCVKNVSVIEEETYHTARAETDSRHGTTASWNRPLQHCSVDGT